MPGSKKNTSAMPDFVPGMSAEEYVAWFSSRETQVVLQHLRFESRPAAILAGVTDADASYRLGLTTGAFLIIGSLESKYHAAREADDDIEADYTEGALL